MKLVWTYKRCKMSEVKQRGSLQAQGYRRRRFQDFLLFCTVPWILTPACKAKFFKVEAMMQMQRQVHASGINVRSVRQVQKRPPCMCSSCHSEET